LIAKRDRPLRHHVQRDAQKLLLRGNDRPQLLQSFSLLIHVNSPWRLSDGERLYVGIIITIDVSARGYRGNSCSSLATIQSIPGNLP
jgi:hypothetical protein